jgi:hypothetical protein
VHRHVHRRKGRPPRVSPLVSVSLTRRRASTPPALAPLALRSPRRARPRA